MQIINLLRVLIVAMAAVILWQALTNGKFLGVAGIIEAALFLIYALAYFSAPSRARS